MLPHAFAAVAAFALCTAAHAVGTYGEATPPTENSSRFERLDSNNDGYLNDEELRDQPTINAALPRLDSNGDGRLDKSEFSALEPEGGTPAAPR